MAVESGGGELQTASRDSALGGPGVGVCGGDEINERPEEKVRWCCRRSVRRTVCQNTRFCSPIQIRESSTSIVMRKGFHCGFRNKSRKNTIRFEDLKICRCNGAALAAANFRLPFLRHYIHVHGSLLAREKLAT